MDQFFHVAVVGLRVPPYFPIFNRAAEDYGAPVFVPVYDQCEETKIIAAQPVGLLLNSRPIMPLASFPGLALTPEGLELILSIFITYFTYQPLDRILDSNRDLDLLISPQQPNLAERGCV
jgi:hypothetical protein